MLIDADYRGHRIEVNAVAVDGRWNAEVRIRQYTVNAKPHVEVVTCYKLTPGHAEIAGARWAQRWIDAQLNDRPESADSTANAD